MVPLVLIIFLVGDKMKCTKKGIVLGMVPVLLGTGVLVYKFVLSPKTKEKMMSLEEDMCEDFENMI